MISSVDNHNLNYSQKIGYEFRTNGKAYISTSYAGFEIRHRTDREENRFTYRHKFIDSDKFTLSLPLHYKVEKDQAIFEIDGLRI